MKPSVSRRIAGVLPLILFVLLARAMAAPAPLAHPAKAPTEAVAPEGAAAPPATEPWHVKANRLIVYHASNVVIGEGAAEVWRGTLHVTADRIVYDKTTGKVWATGAVVIHMDQDTLTGSKGEMNLTTSTGTMEDAHLFLQRNNIHLVANQIQKTGPEEYRAKQAIISTCPLPKQAWQFKFRDLRLTLGGMAVGRDSTFNIRKVPLFYSPWVAIPINKQRKSGFLLPYFTSSKRSGMEIEVPFFWAINDSMDATFYQHPMAKRGWMEGAEMRYLFSDATKGIFRYNFLWDTLSDDDFNHDGQVRSNQKRWWLRGKANQELPNGFQAKVDLDLISDRDYLLEFDGGPMGYDETNRLFRKYFGRSMSDRTDLIRSSTVQVTKYTENSFIGAEGRYNDNQVSGEQDTTIQTAPRLVLHGFEERIGETPLFFDHDLSYVNYWRESDIKEQRLHLQPRVSMPANLRGWGNLLLSGSLENSFYKTSGGDPVASRDSASNRFLYLLQSDLATTLARVYKLQDGTEFRHSIRPLLTYAYRPTKDQDNLPDIDRLDRLAPENQITYSLLSFLSRKKPLGGNRYAYSDLVRFRISQTYSIQQDEIQGLLLNTPHHPFSDIYAELELQPTPSTFFRYDTTYNLYGDGFTSYNFLGRISRQRGDHFNVDYRYDQLTAINELNLDVWVALSEAWYGTYRLKSSFEADTEFESDYGLRYQSSCWAVEGRFSRDRSDTRISFNLQLLGIGGWTGLN